MSSSGLDGPRIEPASGGPAKQLVIFCHGYGANGQDLIGLGAQWRDLLPDAAFVSPNAPEPVPGFPGGYQWFAIVRVGQIDMQLIEEGIRTAAPTLEAFIDEELARVGLTEDKLALVGFSQGTMMALHVGLRRAKPLAAILGYSGLLAGPERLADEIASRPPVQLIHGDQDPVIPVQATRDAAAALAGADVSVRWHVSPGVPHGIGPDGLQIGGAFLKEHLTSGG
ncbi:MAG: dienelactone hydrolase family protein [Pseudomonadota bacterium]